MRLDIHLQIDPTCVLSARDQSSYTYLTCDLDKHVALEYLIYKDEIVDEKIIKSVIEDPFHRVPSIFKLKCDGCYTYRRILIPNLDHFHKIITTEAGDQFTVDDIWTTENKYFYYKGSFYYSDKNLETAADVKSLRRVTNYNELWEVADSQGFAYYENNVFSICKLEKYLLSLQKETILNCYTSKCGSNKDLKYKRDFALDSVFVIKYMLSLHQFEEAQRILDNISSCSEGYSVCGDNSNNYSSNCGCGNSI